jgi:hypothetical protein
MLFWADQVMGYGQPEVSRWQQVLTNRYDRLLAGAGHYSADDAGEEAAQVIRAWWAAARA